MFALRLSSIASLLLVILSIYHQYQTITVTSQSDVCAEDEYECETFNGTFTFPNRTCIPSIWVCDYDSFNFPIPDCPLGDDEWNCSSCGANHTIFIRSDNETRTEDDYICPSTGICIPYEWSCANGDTILDCWPNQEDVSQEVCEETNDEYVDCDEPFVFIPDDPCFGDEARGESICFKCNNTNGRCINEELVCDNVEDCLDAQDEMNCPTLSPSNMPTLIPSLFPSNIPSIDPTAIPTINPTNIPSTQPSQIPTQIPLQPTNNPTIPTINPSLQPSIIPTSNPTLLPTTDPSNRPTIMPTEPTNTPTVNPSNKPTNIPSNNPTINPSNLPTVMPTDPSNTPTIIPSINPTNIPSIMTTIVNETEGKCCHARRNPNRYELFCNNITQKYIEDCQHRPLTYIRCRWDFDEPELCPIRSGSKLDINAPEIVPSEDTCNCEFNSEQSDDRYSGPRSSLLCDVITDRDSCEARDVCYCAD